MIICVNYTDPISYIPVLDLQELKCLSNKSVCVCVCVCVCVVFSGSNCSSGSEGEATTLQAGICVKQLCVSIKDTIIAREALSLLVTCLQLRSQQLCE